MSTTRDRLPSSRTGQLAMCKDVIGFDFGDSGKTAYFAVQIENDGKKGPWGPLVSALIP